jgi:hypothetical protein
MIFHRPIFLLLISTVFIVNADNKTLDIHHKTRFSTLATNYYSDTYYDALIKVYNNKIGEFLYPGDSVIIPDIDSLLITSVFSEIFKEEMKLLYKASSLQTSMYTYEYDLKRMGIDSLSKNGIKGARLIYKAVKGIKSKCDSLHYPYPTKALSQLNSSADEMLQYENYLHGGDIYATKNIYVQNQHMRLWKLYAALWILNGFK